MLQAAAQGMSVESIRELRGMAKEDAQEERIRAFNAALAAAKAEFGPIIKAQTVDYPQKQGPGRTRYKFANLNDVSEAVDPALSRHGLVWRHASTQQNDLIYVTCRLSHEDGYFEDNTLSGPPDLSGQKNVIQAIGSTISYLQRYTLRQALGLSAGEDDDGQGGAPAKTDMTTTEDPLIGADDIAWIEQMLKDTNLRLDVFLDRFHVGGIAHLRVSEFKQAFELLTARKKLIEEHKAKSSEIVTGHERR